MFSAALHLAFLVVYRQGQYLLAIEILLNFAPLAILTFDWMLNRIYLNLYASLLYPLFAYTFYLVYWEMTRSPVTASKVPEMGIFRVYPITLAYSLPLISALAILAGF